MTDEPNNALHSSRGFFGPNLVATGYSWANWPLVYPRWSLHDLWSQQSIMLWSRVLPIKFGGHTTFQSKLTCGWPQVTPAWLLTSAMRYTLVRDFSHWIWWPWGIPKQFDLWLTLADSFMTFDPSSAPSSGQGFFHPNLVAIGHSYGNFTSG